MRLMMSFKNLSGSSEKTMTENAVCVQTVTKMTPQKFAFHCWFLRSRHLTTLTYYFFRTCVLIGGSQLACDQARVSSARSLVPLASSLFQGLRGPRNALAAAPIMRAVISSKTSPNKVITHFSFIPPGRERRLNIVQQLTNWGSLRLLSPFDN